MASVRNYEATRGGRDRCYNVEFRRINTEDGNENYVRNEFVHISYFRICQKKNFLFGSLLLFSHF